MTAIHIIGIILACAFALAILIGFISDTGHDNTYENLYYKFIDGRNERLKIKLDMKKEETKQLAIKASDNIKAWEAANN